VNAGQLDAGQQTDGRRVRGRQTAERIVDALITLIESGDTAPSTARIAERAGISARLVYHHFQDLEELMSVAVDWRVAQINARCPALPASGPLRTRIEAVVAQRADVLEWVTPLRLAAMRMEPYSARLREGRDSMLARARGQLAMVFARELDALPAADRTTVLAALDAATSWGAWYHLRLSLEAEQARAVVSTSLHALLSQAGRA
jgi:AcrR family transcriptional regulator